MLVKKATRTRLDPPPPYAYRRSIPARSSTAGVVESDLRQRLADTDRCLNDAAAAEAAIRAETPSAAVTQTLGLLSQYQRRLGRNYDDIFEKLEQVQEMRRAAEKEEELPSYTF